MRLCNLSYLYVLPSASTLLITTIRSLVQVVLTVTEPT